MTVRPLSKDELAAIAGRYGMKLSDAYGRQRREVPDVWPETVKLAALCGRYSAE